MGTRLQHNWFQYFFVFNLYRKINKFEYISEKSHTVVNSESCLHYLAIDNWFHNFRLFDLQWTIWMYLLTYNLLRIQWFKEIKDFFTGVYLICLKKSSILLFYRLYRKTILALLYTFVESFILTILLFVESVYWIDETRRFVWYC